MEKMQLEDGTMLGSAEEIHSGVVSFFFQSLLTGTLVESYTEEFNLL